MGSGGWHGDWHGCGYETFPSDSISPPRNPSQEYRKHWHWASQHCLTVEQWSCQKPLSKCTSFSKSQATSKVAKYERNLDYKRLVTGLGPEHLGMNNSWNLIWIITTKTQHRSNNRRHLSIHPSMPLIYLPSKLTWRFLHHRSFFRTIPGI